MKRIVMFFGCLFALQLSMAQDVIYDENAEVRQVPKFSGIDVSGTVSLYLSQGSESGVIVSAVDSKYNNKIKTEVINGVLKISVDGGVWNSFSWANKKLKAYVSVGTLHKIGVSGASFLNINGVFKSDTLGFDISGASEIRGRIEVSHYHLNISGASESKLSGSAGLGIIGASGAARLNNYDLQTKNCTVNASGAASVRITATNELNAAASGGSSIYYKGKPALSKINSSGGSSIKNKDD